jgi:Rad3-related DNA helicase
MATFMNKVELTLLFPLQNNVVILDEAHNVEKICEESVSICIRTTDVTLCIQEVTQVRKLSEQHTHMACRKGE